jgi:uracil-DNA glycosylase family 4
MTPAADERALLADLRWQIEAGADEAVADEPLDRFAAPPPKARPAPGTEPEHAPAPPVQSTHAPSPPAEPAAPAQTMTSPPEMAAAPRLDDADKVNADARAQAANCADLEQLRTALAAFDGCALKTTATNLVFGVGASPADVMFVGEAPGRDEDREGVPFVGASGQLLDAMLGFVDLDRATNAYISNILPWRPPGNRQPTGAEIAACLPFLERHIALVAPRVLVFLGGTAAKTLLDRQEGITRLRGRWYEYTSPSLEVAGIAPIPAMATLHPAYLLRQPAQKRAAWHDIVAVREKLDEAGPLRER